MNRHRSWLLTTLFVVLGLLAACGSGTSSPVTTAPTTAPAADSATAAPAADSATAAPAADSATTAPADTSSGETVELRISWWGGQIRHDRTLQVIEMFEKEHPNIKITPEYGSWNDYWTKLSTQAAGGNLPDVIQQDYGRIGEWQTQGLLLPLDSYIDDGTIDFSDIAEGQVAGGRIDGKLYALNLGTNALTILYDPELFSKAGIDSLAENYTWQDLLATAGKIHESEDIYGLDSIYNSEYFKLWLRSNGKALYTDDGKAFGYDDDALAEQYFQLLLDGQNSGATPTREFDAARGSIGPEDFLIVTQKAASMPIWSNQVASVSVAAKDRALAFELPPIAPGGKQAVFLKPSQFFSIASTSKHPKEAAIFIDYFTNSIEANKVLAAERGVPISSKIREALQPELPTIQQQIFEYISKVETVATPISPPEPAAHSKVVSDVYDPLIDELLYGQISPEEAAKRFREEATPLLSQ